MNTAVTKNKERGTFFNGSMGFTLLELMIAVGLFGLVMAGSFGVYIMCQRAWHATSLRMDTARMASVAIERMVYGIGNNSGLRAAATIAAYTNTYNSSVSCNYWDTTAISPPEAGNSANTIVPGAADGSWRIVLSNSFDGVKWIDYVKKQRSIVFWPDIDQPASRMSICNYVIGSTVSNSANGIVIQLTVWRKDGMFVASNQLGTFVKKRNK